MQTMQSLQTVGFNLCGCLSARFPACLPFCLPRSAAVCLVVCLFVCVAVRLSVCLSNSLCRSVLRCLRPCVCLSACRSVRLLACLRVSLSVSLAGGLSVSLSVRLSVCVCVCRWLCPCLCRCMCLLCSPVCFSACRSVCPTVWLPMCASVCLSAHLCAYLSLPLPSLSRSAAPTRHHVCICPVTAIIGTHTLAILFDNVTIEIDELFETVGVIVPLTWPSDPIDISVLLYSIHVLRCHHCRECQSLLVIVDHDRFCFSVLIFDIGCVCICQHTHKQSDPPNDRQRGRDGSNERAGGEMQRMRQTNGQTNLHNDKPTV